MRPSFNSGWRSLTLCSAVPESGQGSGGGSALSERLICRDYAVDFSHLSR